MRYFFRQRIPSAGRVLLVESGSRHLVELLLERWRASGEYAGRIDLVTCYAGAPRWFDETAGKVYQVSNYAGRAGRGRLYRELKQRGYSIGVLVCSGEPIMTKWKWMLAGRLPVKVLIVNENADYFWLDYSNWRTIRQIMLSRSGLSGAGAVRTTAGILLFPFTLAYLLVYTAFVHLRRKVHA